MTRTKTVMLAAIKVAITAGAIYLLLHRVDIQQVLTFRVVSVAALVSTLAAAMLLVFIQAVRWYLIANAVGIPIRVSKAIVAVWFGHFLNNLLPTSTAGDLVRNFTLRYEGGQQGQWLAIFVAEKFAAMLTALIIASWSAATNALPGMPWEVKFLVAAVLVAMLVGYASLAIVGKLLSRHLSPRLRIYLSEIVSAIGTLVATPLGRYALVCSAIINLGMAMIFFMASIVVGVRLDIGTCLFVVPVFSVIASLPISYGGWGIRELSGVHLLGFVGIASDAAFAVTAVYGIVNLLSCLPGLFAGRIFVRSAKVQRSARNAERALHTDDASVGT
ncbi:lysylphosphatidylglycerol synthase transmembrane domain-containing protein [Rhizobium sp. RHZ01]|uniref:lysylphosphatidylglycerol synthase transmembrane domain-containing protein n=1 Tax=Rhizobium sp. RHZ01 TaxID=2769304 RepID=UPI00177B57C8|nr:lysylphosphatidylglycerol synthase transmembrane domain-containing protein [Rhizobium sp. RHZ01]MBD9443995.1 flippase-like domain-containing protein [Rhizobium sp. RHZ01]